MRDFKLTQNSALLLLHEAHASLPAGRQSSEYFRSAHYVKNCISDLTRSVANMSEHPAILPVGVCVKESSSFLVPLLYLEACVVDRIHKENPTTETLQNTVMFRWVLEIFDKRWKVAGKYSLSIK